MRPKTLAWTVIRTTTDKLGPELNDIRWGDSAGQNVQVQQITHVGGRDWVIIVHADAEVCDH